LIYIYIYIQCIYTHTHTCKKIKKLPELSISSQKTHIKHNLVNPEVLPFCSCVPVIAGSTSVSPFLAWMWDMLSHSVQLLLLIQNHRYVQSWGLGRVRSHTQQELENTVARAWLEYSLPKTATLWRMCDEAYYCRAGSSCCSIFQVYSAKWHPQTLQNFGTKSGVHHAQDVKNSNQHVLLIFCDLHFPPSGWWNSVPFTGLMFHLMFINEDSRFLPSSNLG